MSILDKFVARVTPEPSEDKRKEARAKARATANGSGWLWEVLNHHVRIEAAFARVAGSTSATERRKAQEALSLILTGHSIAEESVLYPALALHDQKGASGEFYTEQSAAKVQMAALSDLEPMSQDYLDKLEHIRAAVAHHVYEEESSAFPKLRDIGDAALQAKLSERYMEEYLRYVGKEEKN